MAHSTVTHCGTELNFSPLEVFNEDFVFELFRVWAMFVWDYNLAGLYNLTYFEQINTSFKIS